MPLVAHSDLPTFASLREQGHELLSLDRAEHQDIRELHIGFLNMMPDAALRATERQFIRLVGSCNRIAQFYVYPFSLPELNRSPEAAQYVDQFYSRFEDLRSAGLDALIVTGANVANPRLDEEPFWVPLMDVVGWANDNVASVLCSCLATHALLKKMYGIDRQPLPDKRWGVYSHKVSGDPHPLTRDINTRFDVPHSRYNDIAREAFEAAGLRVLVDSEEGGVHLAVSPDQFRFIYFQGHPEYDSNSLLKEFKREAKRMLSGELTSRPAFPEHYFPPELQERIADTPDDRLVDLLESEAERLLDNTWGDTAKAVINNWLGLVYQTTNLDRHKQYMPGIDPDDPLNLRQST